MSDCAITAMRQCWNICSPVLICFCIVLLVIILYLFQEFSNLKIEPHFHKIDNVFTFTVCFPSLYQGKVLSLSFSLLSYFLLSDFIEVQLEIVSQCLLFSMQKELFRTVDLGALWMMGSNSGKQLLNVLTHFSKVILIK